MLRRVIRDHVMRWDAAAGMLQTEIVAQDSPTFDPPDGDTRLNGGEPPPRPDRPPTGAPVARTPPSKVRRARDECEPCSRHGLEWCSLCEPSELPRVVYAISGRSDAFHESPTCPALIGGQHLLVASGGNAAVVEAVAIESAIAIDKLPCLVCFPATRETL